LRFPLSQNAGGQVKTSGPLGGAAQETAQVVNKIELADNFGTANFYRT